MKRFHPSLFDFRPARIGALGALVVCTACAGTLDDSARFLTDAGPDSVTDLATDGGCPDIPTQVFRPECAGAGCHSAASKQADLDLESPDVASRLVGVRAMGGGLLVDPTHPAASVLYTKLTPTPPYGARMPLVGTLLDGATMTCVLDWISQQGGGSSPEAGGAASGDGGIAPR
jgi:hypothetical protein